MQLTNACIKPFYILFKNKIDSAHVVFKFENNLILNTYTASQSQFFLFKEN